MTSLTLADCKRAATRQDVRIDAIIREPGCGRTTVEILDLSATGFCFSMIGPLAVGARVFLHLPTFAPLEAIVAWRRQSLYGCKFLRPLHVAVFETIAARFPVR